MIKYVIVILNALVVFIFSWLSGDNGINLTGNFPKAMNPGTEVPIELTVKKGNLGGFAKLQLELPEGISVKEGDNKGATFSYVSGLAKWIWTALPADADLVVKCILVADANATGNKTIGGKFSFVENNAKQVSEMPPVEIQLTTNNTSAVNSSTPAPNSTEANTTAIKSNTENLVPTTSEPKTLAGGEPLGNVYATRKVTPLSSNEFQIDIKIKKDGTKGFARYNDNLPEGFTARQSKTDGASFSVADNKIKFVWVSVPSTEELTISYLLKGSNTKPEELIGEYSYLEDNQSKKVKVLPDLLPATPEIAAVTPEKNTSVATSTEPKSEPKVNETTSVNTTPSAPVSKEPKEKSSNANTTSNKTEATLAENLAKKEGKVNYAVQVGAFVNGNVNAEVLAKKFNLSANIRSEMKDGFHKFLIGSHNEYIQARDQREVIKTNNGINGAFVVAYNNGQRITVQEALTISSQKWFK